MRTTTLDHQRSRIRRLALASSIVVLVAFGAAGCGGSDDDTSSTTTTSSSTAPSQQSGGSNQGGNSGQSGNSGGQSGGGATGPAPTIVNFVTPDNIDCHNGNQQNFTASWETTDATRVAISGGSSNLPANGSTSLPFNCSSAHTFTLTAYSAGGRTASQSITLQPRNVQQPSTPDDT
jgi:hypothetical protein